jgi:hypothetical protein
MSSGIILKFLAITILVTGCLDSQKNKNETNFEIPSIESPDTEPDQTPSDERQTPPTPCQEILKHHFMNELSSTPQPSFNALLDFTRKFINTHSQHSGPLKYSPEDVEAIACDINAYLADPDASPRPTLYCSERTKLGQIPLSWLDIKTHKVDIFTSWDSKFPLGHVFLEAQNPDDETWQVMDPDYDIYYWDGEKRLSALDLIYKTPELYLPCNTHECGWGIVSTEGFYPSLLRDLGYYGVVYLREPRVMHINTQIFNKDIRYEHLNFKTFPEYYSDFKVEVTLYSPDYYTSASQTDP